MNYTKTKLRNVYLFIKNGRTLDDLRSSMDLTEAEANDVYYQAYRLYGLDDPAADKMPIPLKGSLVVKGKKIKKDPKPAPHLLTRYLERPPDDYSNKGYLSLLKQYST